MRSDFLQETENGKQVFTVVSLKSQQTSENEEGYEIDMDITPMP